MATLEQRTATLSEAEPCASCCRPLGGGPPEDTPDSGILPPYLLFPTGNAFHGMCLAREVLALATPSQKQRLQDLLPHSRLVRLISTHPAHARLLPTLKDC